MPNERKWTPQETAALDAAFEAGVREALDRGTSLYLQLTHVPLAGAVMRPLWIAMYPPPDLASDTVAGWCEQAGFRPSDDDLFFPHAHVVRAARDLGVMQ